MEEEVIERILEGDFAYENGSLDFSCTKLELTIKAGERREGSFRIFGEQGKLTQGSVISSDGRMECVTREFVGSEEEIFYCFHGENLEEGEVVKGEFYVISNQGEYYLPFVVNVEYMQLDSSLGTIRNLFHFANLAKAYPEEAADLFYSADFARIFNGSDRQYYEYYLGMSACGGNRQNVEEFLIGINKKQKIEYLTDRKEIYVEEPEGLVETEVLLTRNGWGYTALSIETEGDFLYTESAEITEQDFAGNTCRLIFVVDSAYLHDGSNFGNIRITGSCEEMEIPVVVSFRGAGDAGRRRRERKRLVLDLMALYQSFRLKRISAAAWLRESGGLVERMTSEDEQDISARLFQAQLLITEERFNEAGWVLERAADILYDGAWKDPVLEAYYLYLTTLVSRDEAYIDRITGQVEHIYKKNRGEWRVAWLLLYLSDEYNRSFSKRWMFLEEQFERGCRSPIIYVEALLLLNLNPSLLTRLHGFERQLLLYGAKQECLNGDVILQFVYLVQKEKEYSDCLYRVLEACYRLKPEPCVLQEICSLLIKGNKTGTKYLDWYRLGVEHELRITRLYEYYVMSVDIGKTERLPKVVLMYFSYQNSLSYELAAFVYANVYRDRHVFPELYESYANTIEQFVIEQICKRRITRDLAYLYKEFVQPRMLTEEVAEALAELLFVHLIQTPQKEMRYVVVYQAGLAKEKYYPVTDGHAFVSLPGADSVIIFEDEKQNRYSASVPYATEKLLLPGKLVKLIAPAAGNQQALNLYMCMSGREPVEVTEDNALRFCFLLEDDEVSAAAKRAIGMKLMHYYYDNDKIAQLDDYLEQVQNLQLSKKERAEVLRFMVIRGKEEAAYEWLRTYGPYGMEPKTLVRLCAWIIRENEYVEEPVLLEAVWYAFRHGKYDEKCLRYLTLYFKGLTRELRDIYKAAAAFCVDTYELCEKMLLQMLFSGSFVGEKTDIFKTYVSGGAKAEVEAAFLSQCAYEYFVKDRVTEGYLFEEIAAVYRRGENVHLVCKLGFIKYYAENREELTGELKTTLYTFIHEMLAEHIRLKMFLEFPDLPITDRQLLSDRTIVEYKAHPEARAVMHYCVESGDGAESVYRTEEMQEAYGGVCYKDFVLFFGERLQYYIMENRNGSEQLTESAAIQMSETGGYGTESKYDMLNDLSISNTLQDYDTVDNLLTEYAYKEFLKNGLFSLT